MRTTQKECYESQQIALDAFDDDSMVAVSVRTEDKRACFLLWKMKFCVKIEEFFASLLLSFSSASTHAFVRCFA